MWLLVTSKQPRYRLFEDRSDAIETCCSEYVEPIVDTYHGLIYSHGRIVGHIRECVADFEENVNG